ncbi:MAG: DegT/DnrJ/EryC1/StrS family aminotransferase [Flavobacteriales bacterium]|nr:DegT/DnrJ/EryC1/StrS family aminotransferase [Flavobacteriales bacterium]
MKVNFLDLKGQYHQIKNEVLTAVEDVFENTAFTNGPHVKKFEENFAAYCQTKYCSSVNNGTSALHLAMVALNIGPGDEVIMPANTFIATAWGPAYVGATPVFVDCDPNTWEIDVEAAEKAITLKTKAIIGVHLYGKMCDVEALKAICDKHNIYFVEDAAQAQGSKYKGVRSGGFGELACFSFYPGKNLGTYGEGGGITTNNKEYYDRIQKLKNHASEEKYFHQEIGYNMRMGGVEGAVLDIKLRKLDEWNGRRREIAARYQSEIVSTKIRMQEVGADYESNYHLFVVTVENREHFMEYLKENEIFAGMHYPVSCHLQKAFTYLGYSEGDFPQSEYLAAHCVSLPMYAELTDEEVSYVIEIVNNY